MASLKSLIPHLARTLDMKPAAIYERQRALLRAGLLERVPGHGPGSGVLATPKSLAMLLIAILATESLSETEEQARIFANLKLSETFPRKANLKRCPMTGKKMLADALTAVFASDELAGQLSFITATRSRSRTAVEIAFREKGEDYSEMKISSFASKRAADGSGGVSRQAGLGALTFAAIVSTLRGAIK